MSVKIKDISALICVVFMFVFLNSSSSEALASEIDLDSVSITSGSVENSELKPLLKANESAIHQCFAGLDPDNKLTIEVKASGKKTRSVHINSNRRMGRKQHSAANCILGLSRSWVLSGPSTFQFEVNL